MYGGGVFFCIALLFISCENFLKSSEIAQEIKDTIDYNNAPSSTIVLNAPEGTGKFLSGNEKTCKLGYTINVQFSVNQNDYVYTGMQAVSKLNPEISRAEYIQFIDQTSEEEKQNGTFKVQVKLLKLSDDIMIQPVCLKVPKIISVTPGNDDLAYANTPIVITFNIPMEDETVTSNNSVFKYDNKSDDYITIKFNSEDFTKYFYPPEFNEDKTVLTLAPQIEKFTDYLQDELKLPSVIIKIGFGEKIIVQKKDIALSLNENQRHLAVNFRQDAETEPPEEINNSFFISREEITPENEDELRAKAFHQEDISTQGTLDLDVFKTKVFHNITNGTIYISGTYYDKDSGVKTISVKSYIPMTGKEDTLYFTKESDDSTFITEDGYTTFYVKVPLINESPWNFWCYKIFVNVLDACGIPSETKVYYLAVKGLDISGIQLLNYDSTDDLLNTNTETFNMALYKDKIKKIRIERGTSQRNLYEYYRNVNSGETLLFPVTDYTIECEYMHKDGSVSKDPLSPVDEANTAWELSLDVDSVNNLDAKIIISDSIGNTSEQTFTFEPVKGLIIDEIKSITNSQNKKIKFDYSLANYTPTYLIWKEGQSYKYKDFNKSDYNIIEDGKDYYLYCKGKDSYTPPISDDFYNTKIKAETVPAITLVSELKPEKGSRGKINYVLTIPDDSWTSDKYDMIYVELKQTYTNPVDNSTKTTEQFVSFPKNETTLTIAVSTQNMFYSQNCTLYLYGMKNSILSEKKEYTISRITDKAYDNVGMSSKTTGNSFDYYTQESYKDYESGMSHVDFFVNETLVTSFSELNEQGWMDVNIPRQAVFEKDDVNYISIIAYDQAGNSSTAKFTDYTAPYPASKITSNNSTSLTVSTGKINEPFSTAFTWALLYSVFKFEKNSSTNENWTTVLQNDQKTKKATVTQTEDSSINEFSATLAVPSNSFIKIISRMQGGSRGNHWNNYAVPRFYYTGTQNSGKYDFILPNGSEKDSVAISSDAPVLVTIYSTPKKLSDIQNWKADDWEFRAYIVDEEVLSFNSNSRPEKYKIKKAIPKGSCYVVVVHFANGTTTMSQIMQKE